MNARWISPLRYPGGKVRMAGYLAEVFHTVVTDMEVEIWAEVFGGGAGAALMALDRHDVPEAWIFETNPALHAFWREVTESGEAFAERVESTVPTLSDFWDARERVRAALAGEAFDRRELGFAAFVLNRCSRSGMVMPNVGPIGGRAQSGAHTLDSRWNGVALAERIRHVARFGERFRVMDGSGIDFVEELDGCGFEEEVFLFADPPDIGVGNRLYAAGMDRDAHERLATALQSCPSPWVLTYDAHPDVLDLYGDCTVREFDIPHTANRQAVGTEYLVTTMNLRLPPGNPLGRGGISEVGSRSAA